MTAKQRSQAIQYADRIVGALNRVELLRESACNEFYPYGEKACRLWRTAQRIEDAVIRENGLPDLDAILVEIADVASIGCGVQGGPAFHSYTKSVHALWDVERIVRKALATKFRLLLDIIEGDCCELEYYPVEQMLAPREGGAE